MTKDSVLAAQRFLVRARLAGDNRSPLTVLTELLGHAGAIEILPHVYVAELSGRVIEAPAIETLQALAVREQLTPTELRTLSAAAEGLGNVGTADKFHVSPETVKSHRRHILSKLAAKNITHAVAIAFKNGLFEEPAEAAAA